MYFKIFKIVIISITLIFLGCDDPVESSENSDNEEEVTVELPVQIQVVGSLIEGMIVCDTNNSCKQTDTNGMVSFEKFDDYAFKINDINISTLTIDNNMSIISPYTFFDTNETLAKNFLLLLHAFDKGSDITDEKVSLTFSSYIPTVSSIKTFIEEKLDGEDLVYSVNDHNITIDMEDNSIDRDNVDSTILVPSREIYKNLDHVSNFIEKTNDKNVTLGNIGTKYILKRTTLTSFTLGERYRFTASVNESDVLVEIYDSTSRTTDNAKLIIGDDNSTLITNLVSVTLVE